MANEKEVSETLERFASDIPGFIGASLVDLDSGMTLAVRSTRPDFDLAVASAYNSELVKQKQKIMRALNLDTHLEDFKFWMAHELAHVFTPELAGKDDGEDFADAFAGALLFPQELAHHAYVSASHRRTPSGVIGALHDFARDHMISLFSV